MFKADRYGEEIAWRKTPSWLLTVIPHITRVYEGRSAVLRAGKNKRGKTCRLLTLGTQPQSLVRNELVCWEAVVQLHHIDVAGSQTRRFKTLRGRQPSHVVSHLNRWQETCLRSPSLFGAELHVISTSQKENSPSSCSCSLQKWRRCRWSSPEQQSPRPGSPDGVSWQRPRWPKPQLRRHPR